MRLNKILFAIALLISINANAQFLQPMGYKDYSFWLQMNIGNEGAKLTDPSAYLELGKSTGSKKGFLPPRMTGAQRDAILSPAPGLEVYNTTTGEPNFFNGIEWKRHVSLDDTTIFLATKTDLQGIMSTLTNIGTVPPPESGFEVVELAVEGTNQVRRIMPLRNIFFDTSMSPGLIVVSAGRFGIEDNFVDDDFGDADRYFDLNGYNFLIENGRSIEWKTLSEDETITSEFSLDPESYTPFGLRFENDSVWGNITSSREIGNELIGIGVEGKGDVEGETWFIVRKDSAYLQYYGNTPKANNLDGYRLQLRDTVSGAFVDYVGSIAGATDQLLNPFEAKGDLVVSGDADGTSTRIPIGNDGDVLTVQDSLPVWLPGAKTLQDVITAGNEIDSPVEILMNGYPLTFKGSGLFRIEDTTADQGGIYDFNAGVDFLQYDTTKAYVIEMNLAKGIGLRALEGTKGNEFKLTPDTARIRASGSSTSAELSVSAIPDSNKVHLHSTSTIGVHMQNGVLGERGEMLVYGVFDGDTTYAKAAGAGGWVFKSSTGEYKFLNVAYNNDTNTVKPVGMDADGNIFRTNWLHAGEGGGGGGATVGTFSTRLGLSPTNGDEFFQTNDGRDAPAGKYYYLNSKWHYQKMDEEQYKWIFDDLNNSSANNTINGHHLQTFTGGTITSIHGGAKLSTGTSATGRALFMNGSSGNPTGWITLADGAVYYKARILDIPALSNASEEYSLRFGLGDASAGADFNNGLYIEYDRTSSVNWRYASAAATSRTKNNSSIAVTTGAHLVEIFYDPGTGIAEYWIDGTSLGTISTTIPSSGLGSNVQLVKSVGTTPVTMDMDYVKAWQRLTISRD